MKRRLISFVESVIDSGSRIRENTVFAHLPLPVVDATDRLVKKHKGKMARGAALWFVLTGNKVPDCHTCGSPLDFNMWLDRREFNYEPKHYHCSCKCAGKDPEVQRLRELTNKKKYGVAMPQQNEELKKKQQSVMLKKYGGKTTAQSPGLSSRVHTTNQKRYGSTSPFSGSSVQRKSKETLLRKYGVEHSMQHGPTFEKASLNGLKTRTIVVRNKTFRLRGYEPTVVKYLASHGVSVKDILHKSSEGLPTIKYRHRGELRAYHPDLLVRISSGKEILVEVKCGFTAGLEGGDKQLEMFRSMHTKLKAAKKSGYEIKLALVEKDETLIIHEPYNKTLKQIRSEAKALRLP